MPIAPANSKPDEQRQNNGPGRDRDKKNQQRRLRPGEPFSILVAYVSCRGTQTRNNSDINLHQLYPYGEDLGVIGGGVSASPGSVDQAAWAAVLGSC